MTNLIEEATVGKIGEDKYTEHWSLDGSTYIEVPKWVVQAIDRKAREEEREKVLELAEGSRIISVREIGSHLDQKGKDQFRNMANHSLNSFIQQMQDYD